MKEFEGRVAVITGAASGIGLGIAEVLANNGMKVMMADIEEEALGREAERLRAANFDATACVTDVSRIESLENLLTRTIETYGKVNVLCNNAGVAGGGGPIWQTTERDWQWVMGVNLMGVVHGVRVFVPHMLEHGEEGHVVNTSSILGLVSGGGGIYDVTKHAVTRLTEGLYVDLRAAGAQISASVLCPGMIATNIITSQRNRPEELANDTSQVSHTELNQMMQARDEMAKRFQEMGMPPMEVGEKVLDAISNDRFYVLTHPENMAGVRRRFETILNLEQPQPRNLQPD
jgi:NAD(P)-dependent dehydrogenase (short-subunit alcohol dehydrogenase family)